MVYKDTIFHGIFKKARDCLVLNYQNIGKGSSRVISQQRYYKDKGFNSGTSTSRGNNRKKLSNIPSGIAIPDKNIIHQEDALVDDIFTTCSKYLLMKCPWIWEGMEMRRKSEFGYKIQPGNIIEAL